MEKLKILVADASEIFCQALTDTLQGNYRVRVCKDGNEALEILRTFHADILILDLMLSGLDGITLLQRISQTPLRPMVLATTRYVSEYILDSAERLGIGYLMIKPCDTDAVAARVADMTQRMKVPVFAGPDNRTQVSNMLLNLRFSTKLRGYGYLREAVLLMAKNPGQSITKELYPAVARHFRVTSAQVERSIRSALQQAWQRREGCAWQLYIPTGNAGCPERPSNGTLISCLADRLLLSQELLEAE
ncbi:MAG: response regulator [Oscillospiraceae bacterium]|nr:response regulator [Oscillospiraceae bacterium]